MADCAALVATLIVDRPMCIRCIATQLGLTPAALDATIGAIGTALVLHRLTARCAVCGATDTVLSINRPQ
jgi:hypothetical protein